MERCEARDAAGSRCYLPAGHDGAHEAERWSERHYRYYAVLALIVIGMLLLAQVWRG